MKNNTQQTLIDEVIEIMMEDIPEIDIELNNEVIEEMVKNHEESDS